MERKIVVTGAVLGLLAVALGAFGAHGLKNLVEAPAVGIFETGVRYQMYHVLVLLVLAFMPKLTAVQKKRIFFLFLGGILCFSGSLYLLTFNSITAFDFAKIGIITPIGGLFFLAGWALLAMYGYKALR